MRFLAFSLWIFINWILECTSLCKPEYGPNPTCSFVPAPPGKTPPCARPGLTYCEYPDRYPSELIFQLIQKWQFDHKSLIINEAKEDFNSVYFPPPSTVYGPPAFVPNLVQNNDGGYHYPEPIYIPKPPQTFPEQGGFYIPPKPIQPHLPQHNFSLDFNGYPDFNKDGTFLTYKYSSNFPQTGGTQYNANSYQSSPIFAPPTYTHINDIWKRNERLKRSLRKKRTLDGTSHYLDNPLLNGTAFASVLRPKRQSTVTGQSLCRSRSSYIMPKAALNSKGNWMYVVNMPETNQQYTQLVKSEMCADTNCNGLCQLPQGYSSKCEQKYVQKRLIALEGNGSDLYSDTFWFPSCCICTISNN
ncbi:protein spaetzle 5-like [Dendroctonus ponderosae]|uniref:protein spaetzle 5 n=1 Tax=Dendroctonus ponderosae TaxID=77166 RepID=UPI002035432C|nr:protein spaetzle 5 [Dendroctonus ponderosae]XP_048520970.1 protein spaetzle 5-like [Dendroctonus ponderosae]